MFVSTLKEDVSEHVRFHDDASRARINYEKAQQLEYSSTDTQKILKQYLKAAFMGSDDAQNAVGILYMLGKYVNENTDMAIKWFKLAAKKGNKNAQLNLAALLVVSDIGQMDWNELYESVLSGVEDFNIQIRRK